MEESLDVLGCSCRLITQPWEDGNMTGVVPIPDIAGNGVLLGLVLPNIAILAIITAYYLFAVDSNDEQMCAVLDRAILAWLKRWRWGKWRLDPALAEKLILSFSDTQLVNGLSLMASALINRCDISSYHWQILISCVWFSTTAHLAALPLLKRKLRTSSLMVWLRLSFMTVVFVMLIIATIPTGHSFWFDPRDPGVCYFKWFEFERATWGYDDQTEFYWATVAQGMIFGWPLALLSLAYLRCVYGLVSDGAAPSWFARLRKVTGNPTFGPRVASSLARLLHIPSGRWRSFVIDTHVFAVIALARAFVRLAESFFWHLVWLLVTTTWGVVVLIKWKVKAAKFQGDNDWSVGQIMPLFLLALPLMNALESVCDSREFQKEPDKGPLPPVDDSSRAVGSFRITLFLLLQTIMVLVGMALVGIFGEGPFQVANYFAFGPLHGVLLVGLAGVAPVIFAIGTFELDFMLFAMGPKQPAEANRALIVRKAAAGLLVASVLVATLIFLFGETFPFASLTPTRYRDNGTATLIVVAWE